MDLGMQFTPLTETELKASYERANNINSTNVQNNIPFSEYILEVTGANIYPKEDGEIHRFKVGKGNNKDGWYVYRDLGGIKWGKVGDWSSLDEPKTWTSKGSAPLTIFEKQKIERATEELEEKKKIEQKDAAEKAEAYYTSLDIASSDFGYFINKGIDNNTGFARFDAKENCIVIPCLSYTDHGDLEICSIQQIWEDGKKKFYPGAKTKGAFLLFGEISDQMFLCEGFATGISIYNATGRGTVIAFSCHNLKNVADSFKIWNENTRFTIIADNDVKSNMGEIKAKETGLPYILIPEAGMDANDYARAGYDLASLIMQKKGRVWLQSMRERRANLTIPTWLIKKWIPEIGLTMIFGTPGSGKSFVVIDILCTIASSKEAWFDSRAKNGKVVYLCGEGHRGVDARVAAWAEYHNLDPYDNLYISPNSIDLCNYKELEMLINDIVGDDIAPRVIAIDTLNRFYTGDENDAQEMSQFIKVCSYLSAKFSCAVIIVHHTGVAQEAQGRARGSSALNGAMDASLCVTRENTVVKIAQAKQKDVEAQPPLSLMLESIAIRDFPLDEDGAQVTSGVLRLLSTEEVKDTVKNLPYEEINTFAEAWFKSPIKNFIKGDIPELKKSDLRSYLRSQGLTTDEIKGQMRKDRKNNFYAKLFNAGQIEEYGDSYLAKDYLLSVIMLSYNWDKNHSSDNQNLGSNLSQNGSQNNGMQNSQNEANFNSQNETNLEPEMKIISSQNGGENNDENIEF